MYKIILPILCISGIIWYLYVNEQNYFGSNQNNEDKPDGVIDGISGVIQPNDCNFATQLSNRRWTPEGYKPGDASQQIKIQSNKQVIWNINKLFATIIDVSYDDTFEECRGSAKFVGGGVVHFTIQGWDSYNSYKLIDWDNKSRWMPCPRCSWPR